MPINYPEAFFFAGLSTAAFAVLFQAPRRTLPGSAFIGAVGWVVFCWLRYHMEYDSFYANLCAAMVLSLLGELAARLFKQPATVFVIPGIFPIVPGLGMYRGMAQLIEKNYDGGVNSLLGAGLDAAAIALGVMFMASFFRVLKLSRERRLLLRARQAGKQL